jgi:hypothetical protein
MSFVAFFTVSLVRAHVTEGSRDERLFNQTMMLLRIDNEHADMTRWWDLLLQCNVQLNIVVYFCCRNSK